MEVKIGGRFVSSVLCIDHRIAPMIKIENSSLESVPVEPLWTVTKENKGPTCSKGVGANGQTAETLP